MNVDCPAQRVQRIVHFAAAARWTSRVSARSASASSSTPGCCPTPATSTRSTVEQLVPLERIGERVGAAARRQRSTTSKDAAARAAARRARDPPRRSDGARATSRASSAASTASRTASSEELTAVEGVGRVIAESVQQFFAIERNRAVVDKLRAAGVNFEGPPRAEPSAEGADARRPHVRAHGRARRLHRDEADRRDRGARREGHRQRVEEDELRRGGREPGHRSSPRPSSSASRSSTRPGSGELLEHGAGAVERCARQVLRAAPRPIGDAALEERPTPEPGPGRGARARAACALLPDRSARRRGRSRAPAPPGRPRAPGVGVVDARRRRVRRLHAGDRVGVAVAARTCGELRVLPCAARRTCASGPRFTGWTVDGGYADARRRCPRRSRCGSPMRSTISPPHRCSAPA